MQYKWLQGLLLFILTVVTGCPTRTSIHADPGSMQPAREGLHCSSAHPCTAPVAPHLLDKELPYKLTLGLLGYYSGYWETDSQNSQRFPMSKFFGNLVLSSSVWCGSF